MLSFARIDASQPANWQRRVSHTARDLKYSKVCVRSVPRSPTVEHKAERKFTSSEWFARFQAEGETFLTRTVIADETWVRHSKQEAKKATLGTASPSISPEKKSKRLLTVSG